MGSLQFSWTGEDLDPSLSLSVTLLRIKILSSLVELENIHLIVV